MAAVKFLAHLEIYRREVEQENAPDVDVEAKLLELLGRSEPERKQKVRAVVHSELAVLAEHADVRDVEARLVARL